MVSAQHPGLLVILPRSQDFAGAGEIELAYHRIRQPAAELNSSQEPLQRYGVIAPDRVARSKGAVIVDCGFNIWREINRQDEGAVTMTRSSKESSCAFFTH